MLPDENSTQPVIQTEYITRGVHTLTEWKARLQPGTQIRQIWNSHEGKVDHVFTVTQVQSNGVWGTRSHLETRVWLPFPKRGEIIFTENGWSRVEGTRKLADYVWVQTEDTRE